MHFGSLKRHTMNIHDTNELIEDESPSALFSEKLSPARGLIFTHNQSGKPFGLLSIKKWMRLHTSLLKAEKVDLFFSGDSLEEWNELQEFASSENLALSLAVRNLENDSFQQVLNELRLLDLCLSPDYIDLKHLKQWLDSAGQAGIDTRVQLNLPVANLPDITETAKVLKQASAVTIHWENYFSRNQRCSRKGVQENLSWINDLTDRLYREKVDTIILNLPYCLVKEEHHAALLCGNEAFRDHSHYMYSSWRVAQRLFDSGFSRAHLILDTFLSSRQGRRNLADNVLLPWVFGHPGLEARLWVLRRLTRYWSPKFLKRREEKLSTLRLLPPETKLKHDRNCACRNCQFVNICVQSPDLFFKKYRGALRNPFENKALMSAEVFTTSANRYYDSLDRKRLIIPDYQKKLAEEALHITRNTAPSKEIAVSSYFIENHYEPRDDAAHRWYSLSRGEMKSTPVARLHPPFTLMLTFGGGIAELVGFSFGRHAKITCSMIDYSHKIILHVDQQGRYILLRDGLAVKPAVFSGLSSPPERLSGLLEPRISLHNVDGLILTQTLLLWQDQQIKIPDTDKIKYSIIVVCVKYARRLQAVLLSIAHQKGVSLDKLEVVVAYVPGADSVEDLIDSMEESYPELRIVRSPFSPEYARSKGFMINESLHVSSGEWITLLDADIVLPPDIFIQIEACESTAHFIAPDGRKMLSPQTTYDILLGKVKPWEDFNAVAEQALETRYREGEEIPCGFFQCVRREILEKMPYQESDHFEGADWYFAQAVLFQYGKEVRLENTYVLHLDHGGRQWYGTEKHR